MHSTIVTHIYVTRTGYEELKQAFMESNVLHIETQVI